MAAMPHPTRTPLLQRMLDSGNAWGALETSISRYGVTRYRLVVFPPGTSREERILVRLWRSFPVWGLAAWLAIEIVLMTVLSPALAFATSIGAVLTAGVVTMALANHTRANVRTMTVVRMVGVNDPVAGPRLAELLALAEHLKLADAGLAAGELTAIDHEAAAWQVYDRMPQA
jgi:hypothetical protein